jgi:D-alanyl-D-alanine carboxypeptidase
MTQTARALGMSRTTFKNANGLTRSGHLSTARDMTTLGRALFYHFPEYYSLFSRRSVEAGGKTIYNTNRKLLDSYKGADGIKTGYTSAAGFNLVASAERGNERIIATVFGGSSSKARNARIAELLDLGFKKAPRRVAVRAPARPDLTAIAAAYSAKQARVASAAPSSSGSRSGAAATRLAVANSNRPPARPAIEDQVAVVTSLQASVKASLQAVQVAQAASTAAPPANSGTAPIVSSIVPQPKPGQDGDAGYGAVDVAALIEAPTDSASAATPDATITASALAAEISPAPAPRPVITYSTKGVDVPEPRAANDPVVLTRVSTSDGDRSWGITVGTYASQYEAERMLLKTALAEVETLDTALRKVVRGKTGFSANFVGMDQRTASLACQRLSARDQNCKTFGP